MRRPCGGRRCSSSPLRPWFGLSITPEIIKGLRTHKFLPTCQHLPTFLSVKGNLHMHLFPSGALGHYMRQGKIVNEWGSSVLKSNTPYTYVRILNGWAKTLKPRNVASRPVRKAPRFCNSATLSHPDSSSGWDQGKFENLLEHFSLFIQDFNISLTNA